MLSYMQWIRSFIILMLASYARYSHICLSSPVKNISDPKQASFDIEQRKIPALYGFVMAQEEDGLN